ncbi:MAG: dihydroorotase [Syntrophomonadaceae bacterium]|nr:dihydroorotase [Syntrophomonadaceae bacterium]MDD3023492.1 dihydroorotase [Syntrophomonadaceae bacterium]
MRLIIKGGRVIDPANNIDELLDILIADGKIAAVEAGISEVNTETIDARNKIVCPGFIDMHVHLREPGFEYKEDIVSGTKAAAAGGFTTICAMPNTDPPVDNFVTASYIVDRAKILGVVNVLPIGTITKKQAGSELSAIAELVDAGCVAVSDDGKPVVRADIMRNALEYAKMFSIPVLSHCEDIDLAKGGLMHEGYFSTIYGLKGIPTAAEELMAARDIILAELTGAHIHICHASTKGSMDLVRNAKARGINVTCEVTPHHLTLSDEIVGSYDTFTKVNPPLRSSEHISALRAALQDGTVDCIATDHAPHNFESKDCEYELASFGISGLETAIAVVMDKLVNTGVLKINEMVGLFTVGPAKVLGIDKGSLTLGKIADISIIDPEARKVVNPNDFYSKGKNTPYKNMELKAWPWMTIVNGQVVYREGKVI